MGSDVEGFGDEEWQVLNEYERTSDHGGARSEILERHGLTRHVIEEMQTRRDARRRGGRAFSDQEGHLLSRVRPAGRPRRRPADRRPRSSVRPAGYPTTLRWTRPAHPQPPTSPPTPGRRPAAGRRSRILAFVRRFFRGASK